MVVNGVIYKCGYPLVVKNIFLKKNKKQQQQEITKWNFTRKYT